MPILENLIKDLIGINVNDPEVNVNPAINMNSPHTTYNIDKVEVNVNVTFAPPVVPTVTADHKPEQVVAEPQPAND